MHSDVNPVRFGLVLRSRRADVHSVQRNLLIDEEDTVRVGDFGIKGVITDPTVVEPGTATTSSEPGVVRYMAPELINPSQFNLMKGNPTKESDVYSLAITTYEVRSPRPVG